MIDSPLANPIVVILGPTAGGKTTLSVALGQQLPGGGEILSADSMQVYRGMDIGTAKPSIHERGGIAHHLIDIVDPDEPFSVDDWLSRAERAIAQVRGRGHWPIVGGGTNLYVKALLEGLFDGPPADPALRREMSAQSTEELHRRLEEVDPVAARRIHVNDRKRLTRALEVYCRAGKPISQLQEQWGTPAAHRTDVVVIGLDWPTELINRRINARVRQMIDAGLVEEVGRLASAGRLGPQAQEALGYKQILAHRRGDFTLDQAVERIKIETRRFARKQRTWLKKFRNYQPSMWLDAKTCSTQDLVEQSLAFITGLR